MALRVGYEKLNRETGWEPQVSWEEGVRRRSPWYAENRERWLGRVDWLPTPRPPSRPGSPMRTLVTGGGGFLGSHLVERLAGRRASTPFVARRRDYDLTALGRRRARSSPTPAGARLPPRRRGRRHRREPREPRPLLVREPDDGRARARAVAPARRRRSSSSLGTVCAYPKFTPVPFREDDLWNGYPEETNAPYGVAKKALLVGAQAYREQYGLNVDLPAAGEPLRAARQLRPRERARDPGPDPQDARAQAGEARSCSGATARRRASSSTSTTRPRGSSLAAERYDGAEPVNLGTGVEISIRELAELDRRG